MNEQQDIEAAMNHFARTRIALNAKVLAVELNDEAGVWVGMAVSSAGSQRLVARIQADGTCLVSKHIGSLPSKG